MPLGVVLEDAGPEVVREVARSPLESARVGNVDGECVANGEPLQEAHGALVLLCGASILLQDVARTACGTDANHGVVEVHVEVAGARVTSCSGPRCGVSIPTCNRTRPHASSGSHTER